MLSFSMCSAALFLPLECAPDPGLVRCQSLKGLVFLRLRVSATISVADEPTREVSAAALFVADLVAWPVGGGVAGANDCLTGVMGASLV